MSGLKPAVVGLIASAALSVALAVFAPTGIDLQVLWNPSTWFWLIVGAAMLLLTFKYKKMHPVVIVCICAVIGIAAGFLGI